MDLLPEWVIKERETERKDERKEEKKVKRKEVRKKDDRGGGGEDSAFYDLVFHSSTVISFVFYLSEVGH